MYDFFFYYLLFYSHRIFSLLFNIWLISNGWLIMSPSVRSALEQVDEALDSADELSLLAALQMPCLALKGLRPDNGPWYLDQLAANRQQKALVEKHTDIWLNRTHTHWNTFLLSLTSVWPLTSGRGLCWSSWAWRTAGRCDCRQPGGSESPEQWVCKRFKQIFISQ